jgi:ankyrin repeat protein
VVELLAPEAVGVLSARRDGRGPAHWAARHGHTAVLSRLLAWEGQPFGTPNTRTTNGTTMLMLACFGGHVETARSLLDAGAQLHDRNAWDCDVVRAHTHSLSLSLSNKSTTATWHRDLADQQLLA